MKRLPFLLLLILAGCQTANHEVAPNTGPSNTGLTVIIVEASARTGVFYALQQAPELRPGYTAIALSVAEAVAAGRIEPADMIAASSGVVDIQESLWPALSLFDFYVVRELPATADRKARVRLVAEAFSRGIQRGLE